MDQLLEQVLFVYLCQSARYISEPIGPKPGPQEEKYDFPPALQPSQFAHLVTETGFKHDRTAPGMVEPNCRKCLASDRKG
jgi:hypothetical protein